MSKIFFVLLTVLGLFPLVQENSQLTLTLHRDFGYSDGRGSIQDKFSIIAEGPNTLTKVIFYIDDQAIGEVSQPPFRLKFDTDDYPLGNHTISAIGYTSDGQSLASNVLERKFVSAEESWQEGLAIGGKIAIGFIVGIGGIALLVGGITSLTNRNAGTVPLGTVRQYSWLGGTICPKCQRPFSMHLYGLNVGLSKYDRCPHCGKWSLVRRASPVDLAAAEKAELAQAVQPEIGALSEEERLRRQLDDSRFV